MLSALRITAGACLVLLALLCLVWELWLAPLRAGGSLMALKALPALLPLRGVLEGRRYTFQWASMLILAYFTEAVMRLWAERGAAQFLALGELLLSLAFFAAAVTYARLTGTRAAPR